MSSESSKTARPTVVVSFLQNTPAFESSSFTSTPTKSPLSSTRRSTTSQITTESSQTTAIIVTSIGGAPTLAGSQIAAPPPPDRSATTQSNSNTALLVGCIVGGVVFGIMLATIVFLFRRRRKVQVVSPGGRFIDLETAEDLPPYNPTSVPTRSNSRILRWIARTNTSGNPTRTPSKASSTSASLFPPNYAQSQTLARTVSLGGSSQTSESVYSQPSATSKQMVTQGYDYGQAHNLAGPMYRVQEETISELDLAEAGRRQSSLGSSHVETDAGVRLTIGDPPGIEPRVLGKGGEKPPRYADAR